MKCEENSRTKNTVLAAWFDEYRKRNSSTSYHKHTRSTCARFNVLHVKTQYYFINTNARRCQFSYCIYKTPEYLSVYVFALCMHSSTGKQQLIYCSEGKCLYDINRARSWKMLSVPCSFQCWCKSGAFVCILSSFWCRKSW